MKSSTVIFSCVFAFVLATLPYTSIAAPLSSSSNENVMQNNAPHYNNYLPSGQQQQQQQQFQFAQYGPYQQQQNQRLQKKWSRLEPSIRFYKRSQPQFQQQTNDEFANRFMLL